VLAEFSKKILRHNFTHIILTRLVWAYAWFVWLTSRKIYVVPASAQVIMQGEQNAIIAFWHGRMLMMPMLKPKNRDMRVLISRHNDGLLISHTMQHFGVGTVAGSTGKGGAAALREIHKLLGSGANIVITPDGPRGPVYSVAAGIMQMTRRSHLPILPLTFDASRKKTMKSWDKFILPLPFGKLSIVVGEPMQIAGREDGADILQQEMVRLNEKAASLVCHSREMQLFENKEVLESVRRGIEQSANGETSSLGGFSKFVDDK